MANNLAVYSAIYAWCSCVNENDCHPLRADLGNSEYKMTDHLVLIYPLLGRNLSSSRTAL